VNISNVDLNLLVVLHAVLEEQSAAKAAKRLHVTPPAISNALARLRSIFGDPLFVRCGRGLTPTPRALALAPTLARALAELEHVVVGGAGFDPQTTTRELTIALADGDQIASLPRIAKLFGQQLPRARLRVVSIDTLIASGGLAGSQIDVALAPGESEGLHSRPLYEEQGVFVVRRDHPRVHRRLTRELFNAGRHVDIHLALGRAGVGNRAVTELFEQQGLTRDIAVIVPTFAAAAMVVATTDMIAGMPRRVAQMLTSTAPIKLVNGPLPALRFSMQMMWHDRTHSDPASSYFRELIASSFESSRAARASRV
jgi:DNA-binding transcriptional LysR family regulator